MAGDAPMLMIVLPEINALAACTLMARPRSLIMVLPMIWAPAPERVGMLTILLKGTEDKAVGHVVSVICSSRQAPLLACYSFRCGPAAAGSVGARAQDDATSNAVSALQRKYS